MFIPAQNNITRRSWTMYSPRQSSSSGVNQVRTTDLWKLTRLELRADRLQLVCRPSLFPQESYIWALRYVHSWHNCLYSTGIIRLSLFYILGQQSALTVDSYGYIGGFKMAVGDFSIEQPIQLVLQRSVVRTGHARRIRAHARSVIPQPSSSLLKTHQRWLPPIQCVI